MKVVSGIFILALLSTSVYAQKLNKKLPFTLSTDLREDIYGQVYLHLNKNISFNTPRKLIGDYETVTFEVTDHDYNARIRRAKNIDLNMHFTCGQRNEFIETKCEVQVEGNLITIDPNCDC